MRCRLLILGLLLCSVTVYAANERNEPHTHGTSGEGNSSEKPVVSVTKPTALEETYTREEPITKTTVSDVTPTNQPAEESDGSGTVTEEEKEGEEEKEEKEVCFTSLGCFSMGKPWKSITRPILAPLSPAEIKTRVYYYSRENLNNSKEVYVYPRIDMGTVKFNVTKKTCFITHGFASNGTVDWVKELKNAYLKFVDANVFIVDWGEGASHWNYLQVAGNTRVVGRQIAILVQYLQDTYRADLKTFHLIGHSLGAHISSYVAKSNPGIHRLTACDPAQPGFEGREKEVRLDKSDADFVDVIHTDARPIIPTIGFGMMTPVGHVDFYMNGGYDQPGCLPPPKDKLPVVTSILDLGKYPVEVIGAIISCPHGRSYEYLTEAFERYGNCTFWGHKADPIKLIQGLTNTATQGIFRDLLRLPTTCSMDECVPLGFDAEKSPLRGAFFVMTNPRKPFCISDEDKPKSIPEKLFDLVGGNIVG